MNDLYCETTHPVKGIKICPECNGEIIQDIFQLPKDMKRNGGRLIEAKACGSCKIIYEVLPE